MPYPSSLDELTEGVPSDGAAATTALGDVTYQHDDHHRALGVAVEAVETELGVNPSGASATVSARFGVVETVRLSAADLVARAPGGSLTFEGRMPIRTVPKGATNTVIFYIDESVLSGWATTSMKVRWVILAANAGAVRWNAGV